MFEMIARQSIVASGQLRAAAVAELFGVEPDLEAMMLGCVE
jgi:hypothetical protein